MRSPSSIAKMAKNGPCTVQIRIQVCYIVPCTWGVENVRPLVWIKEFCFKLRPEVGVCPVRWVIRLHVLHNIHLWVRSFPQVPQPGIDARHREQSPVEKDTELRFLEPLGNRTLVQRFPRRLVPRRFYFRCCMRYSQQDGYTGCRTRLHFAPGVNVWSQQIFCTRWAASPIHVCVTSSPVTWSCVLGELRMRKRL